MASMTDHAGRMSNMAQNGAAEARDAARDAYSQARETVSEAGDTLRKAARSTAREAAAYGKENADRAYAAAQDVGRSVSRYISERPVEAALIGIGGLVIASLLLRRR